MPQTVHDVIVQYKQVGIDQVNGAMRQFSTTSGLATKSQDALGGAIGQTQGAAIKLRSDIDKGEKSTARANTTTGKYTQTQDKAANSTKSFAEKFRGNRGLIFSVTGIITAGVEAIGMFQNFQNALAKQHDAQERLNQLEREGITVGREYTQAQKDLDDANRSVTFALRIMALSMGDLIPFSLLLLNQFVNMRAAAQQAAAAKQTLTTVTQALGTASSQAAAGGLAQMLTSTGQVTTGVNALTPAVRNTTVATNELFTSSGRLVTGFTPLGRAIQDNTQFIGTRNSGLVGGMSALSVGMASTERQSGRFTDIFRRIGDGIRALPGHFTAAGSSIKGFFTNFGTNIGKLPGLLKSAGTAVTGFGRALIGVFVSNPILGIIAAIGVAISALIFDFGGFRTAINQAGVALGNAIPPLKGVLQWIGEVGNAALDSVAGFFGFETGASKAAEQAAQLAAEIGPLVTGLEQVIETGQKLELLGSNAAILETLRTQVAKLGQQIGESGSYITGTIAIISSNLTNLNNRLKETAPPEVKAALAEVNAALEDIKNTAEPTEAQVARLETAIKNFDATAGGAVSTTEMTTKSLLSAGAAVSPFANEIRQLDAALREDEKTQQKATATMDKGVKVVYEYIKATGLQVGENTKLKETLLANAISVAQYGDKIVIVNDAVVDHAASQKAVADAQDELWEKAFKLWSMLENKLDTVGKEKLPVVLDLIKATKEVNPELGKILEDLYDHWIENIELTQEGLSDLIEKAQEQGDVTEKAEKKAIEAENKRRESIEAKSRELGIWDKIQKLSIDTQDFANKLEEESQKAMDKSKQVLMALAHERGLDIELLEQGTQKNLEYIATHDLAAISIEEVQARTGQLIAARQENQRATALETMAAEELAQALKLNIPLQDATAKGIMAIVQANDDIHDAYSIATDDVITWSAELRRNQVVEEATIEKLIEFADQLGIEIPDSIQSKGIPAIKQYIEEVTGMGKAAEEAAKRAKDAFNNLANETQSIMEDLIKEDVIEGDAKKVKKIIEDMELSVNSLAALQPIIKIGINDKEVTNKIFSIEEIILTTMNGIPPKTVDAANDIVGVFTASMEDEFGRKFPLIGDTINGMWEFVKTENAGMSAAELLEEFQRVLTSDPQAFADAAQKGFIDPILLETGQMKGLLPQEISPAMEAALKAITDKNPQFLAAGGELTGSLAEGAKQGAEKMHPAATHALNRYLLPIQTSPEPLQTGTKVGTDTATGVETGVAPVEGIFSDAFTKASIATTGIINSLFADITMSAGFLRDNVTTAFTALKDNVTEQLTQLTNNINTGIATTLSNLSTSVDTWTNSMSTNIDAFRISAVESFGLVETASVDLREESSATSTSIASHTNSMTSRISSFASSAVSNFDKVGSAASSAASKVGQLQKAIDSLKDKTVTITVRYRTVGSPGGAQHGGSFIIDKPDRVAGVRVAETFPELATITPLDPKEPNSPFHNVDADLNLPNVTPQIPSLEGISAGSSSAGSNVTVQGNLYATIQLPSGETLAKTVKPFMLRGYSGIVS